MGFEQPEKQKTELELLQEEVEKTENEIRAMDPEAPEMEWLKEKLQSLDERMKAFEKPELRTPESYGAPKQESELQKDIEAMAEKIRKDEQERKAS